MGLGDITEAGVFRALTEHDRIGEEAFLAKYGFKPARKYWIVHEGQTYASKAIANVAQAIGMRRAYSDDIKLGGGEAAVVGRLRKLGFIVEGGGNNPAWSRDELILALDLYMTNPAKPPHKGSSAVADLSALLNKMHRLNGVSATPTLRNENGVYLKMMNLRALDPAFTAQGKVGMQSGGKLERVVWADYEGHRDVLATDAKQIRDAVADSDEDTVKKLPVAEAYEGEEGGIIIRLHKRYERDPKLIAEKRKAAAASAGLSCEVCGFDFNVEYGTLGHGYIEVHHTKPVHTLVAGTKTKLADLALLCANCHRMAHRERAPLPLDAIRAAMKLA